MNKISIILVLSSIATVAFFMALPQPVAESAEGFIISDVRLFDGERVREGMSVEVTDGRISKVTSKIAPQGKTVIDGRGKTLLPGLIDAHTHSWGDALTQAVGFGVTTELDMFTDHRFAATARERNGATEGNIQADLFSAGTLVTAPGGHGTEYGVEIPVIHSAAEAADFVSARIDEGSDYIKIVYNAAEATRQDFPSIDRETLAAVIKATHDQNKLAVVHIANLVSAEHAVKAGADGLVHTFMDAPASSALLDAMAEKQTFVIPTLAVMASMVDGDRVQALLDDERLSARLGGTGRAALNNRFPDFGIPVSALQTALDNTRRMHERGITILAGTDAPNPGTAHGISLFAELSLLVEAGLESEQALIAATSATASAFGLEGRGRIEAGALADLVMVSGNPMDDINAARAIDSIWKAGRLVSEQPQVAERSRVMVPEDHLIADFNGGDLASTIGTGFSATTDEMMNGASVAEIHWLDESGGAMQVTGSVRSGFPYPWSGVYLQPLEDTSSLLDLSAHSDVRFRARGSAGSYTMMLFGDGVAMPFRTTFEVAESWQDIRVPLSAFTGADLGSVTGLAWVRNDIIDNFELVLDDIEIE